jgi:hypothetical protein
MATLPKISRAKGVEICADLLYSGQSRKEILQHITENYKASEKTVDNWLKEARVIVAERVGVAKQAQDTQDKATAEASANRLNLTREAMLERLGEIIHGVKKEKPIRVTDGGELEEDDEAQEEIVITKASDVIRAIEVVNKMQGYNAPEKAEIDHTTNGQTIHTTFTIRNASDREAGKDH